jgi:hypothetical protein
LDLSGGVAAPALNSDFGLAAPARLFDATTSSSLDPLEWPEHPA